ncbi:MAG: amidohydrolase family protein [bacterium]|nr:amidohydrolase family protein [bacterium]
MKGHLLLAALALSAQAALAQDVALQAGTVYTVAGDRVLEGGATILIQGGKITAVGTDVEVPAGVRVVDYGPDAVIAPGFVAADTSYGRANAAPRTADPSLRAIDHFDPYSNYWTAVTNGVTTGYIAPARGRLIAGQGAVVKLAGEADGERVVSASAGLHGSISRDARSTPGYWEPPVPATVDVGLGYEQPQLPRTTMGAVIALGELLGFAKDGRDLAEEYGAQTGPQLKELIDAKTTWRMGAETETEVRALLQFFGEHQLPLVIDGASGAAAIAETIAAAKVGVIAAPYSRGTSDFGKGEDAAWPQHDTISKLVAGGVRVAIKPSLNAPALDLLFAAGRARRGGMDATAALRAITLTPAELLGVADRVGSIAMGKDADFAVLSGAPFDSGTNVVATWVDGDVAWKAHETAAVVIQVEELYLGDGEVIAPGEILVEDGVIAALGRRVGRPRGATVVRGQAAMPGMIDALGHLGLEGSRKSFSTRFDLRRIVEPGDYADKRVARSGVTTVNLASRVGPGSGSPTMAYKPAGEDLERMVIKAPNALLMQWTAPIRTTSGAQVKSALKKALEYKTKWEEYEKAIAAWKPPAPKAEEADEDDEEDDEEDEDAEEEDEKDDKKKKKKKKKDKMPARPVTGVWEGTVALTTGATALRLQLQDNEGELAGNMRTADLPELVHLTGAREEYTVKLEGLSEVGVLRVEAELGRDEDDEKDTLVGKGFHGEAEYAIELTKVSGDYKIAKRPERRRTEDVKPPKGKPRSPGINPELEPLRQAMFGNASVIVSVERDDEILACVETFEQYGIKPVLRGAQDAHKVLGDLQGRVAGVLLSRTITTTTAKTGTAERNRYAEISNAGIPIAFYSNAEEGAVELAAAAAWAVARGMSPDDALRALTSGAAAMLSIDDRVGRLSVGLDADVLLLDGAPLDPATSVLRAWVNGREVR